MCACTQSLAGAPRGPRPPSNSTPVCVLHVCPPTGSMPRTLCCASARLCAPHLKRPPSSRLPFVPPRSGAYNLSLLHPAKRTFFSGDLGLTLQVLVCFFVCASALVQYGGGITPVCSTSCVCVCAAGGALERGCTRRSLQPCCARFGAPLASLTQLPTQLLLAPSACRSWVSVPGASLWLLPTRPKLPTAHKSHPPTPHPLPLTPCTCRSWVSMPKLPSSWNCSPPAPSWQQQPPQQRHPQPSLPSCTRQRPPPRQQGSTACSSSCSTGSSCGAASRQRRRCSKCATTWM